MTEVMFGKVRAKVRKVPFHLPGYSDFMVEVYAPGIPSFMFHTVKESSEKDREVARGLMLTLIEAWMRPADFVYHKVRHALEDAGSVEEMEEVSKQVRTEAMDMAKFAARLDPFMNEVHEALWRMAGVQRWGELPGRGPREWMPGRKK